ncbi:SURF1 family protein [Terrihabitans sp. B22-R8]|uniref:SURF1 family protein n=1 Tax=Terrihabitans sp. B22-R8 TaxID=3425128 RepID=UPI00403C9A80
MPRPDDTADDESAVRRRSPLLLGVLGALGLLLFAALIALGTWQVQRLFWKHDLIARVDARVHAEPVAPPARARWGEIDAASDEYRRLRIAGTLLHDRETLVQALTERGAGFWVLTPLRTASGDIVLVNRGFVPRERRDPASRAEGRIEGETEVTGLLRLTEPGGGFLRSNDPAADRWHSRDVAAIAAARGLTDAAPYFIDADAHPNPGGFPVGGLTVIRFSDNHLVYALTWYVLAAMLAGAAFWVVRDGRRLRRAARGHTSEG